MKTHQIVILFTYLGFTRVFSLFGRSHTPRRISGVDYRILRAGSSDEFKTLRPALTYEGVQPPERVLIIMDAFCPYHGGYLSARAEDYPGLAVIYVLSDYVRNYLQNTQPDDQWDVMRLPKTSNEIESWKSALDGLEIVGVYCESDSGLADAEALRERLELCRQDDPPILEARRNKYLMNQVVGQAGLSVATQKLCKSSQEAQDFANQLLKTGKRVVVKPHRGVASESVSLCQNLDQVKEAWDKITSTSVFASRSRHETVLVQEYLEGTEYAVDVVSRDGCHKIAAIWRYDKRPVNRNAFCYFKTELVDANSDPVVETVCEYVKTTLTSLGVKWGLSHNEVIVVDSKGPILVEVNCRQHNMDFCPLTMICIGYNALDMTIDALAGSSEDWDKYPEMPVCEKVGCMVHLVNFKSGLLKQVNHLHEMNKLPSVYQSEVYEEFLTLGSEITVTTDIKTDAGWVQLISDDSTELDNDYKQIVDWMPTMFDVQDDETLR